MFGFGRKTSNNSGNVIDRNLKQSRLRIKILELRLLQYSIIEEMARCYLKSVNIDYDRLDDSACWTIMIGAYIATGDADDYNAISNPDSVSDGFRFQFAGYLQNVIPFDEYQSVVLRLSRQQRDSKVVELRQSMKAKWDLTEFEARMRTLAVHVACMVSEDEKQINELEDVLYEFYLKAADNYFQGSGQK